MLFSRVEKLDWQMIASIEPENIENLDTHVDKLQAILPSIAFARLENEFSETELNKLPGIKKIFRLAQMIIQYLIQCQDELSRSLAECNLKIEEQADSLQNLKLERDKAVRHSKVLRNDLRSNRKVFEEQQSVFLKGHPPGELQQCLYCHKRFLNSSYLVSHVNRRHGNMKLRGEEVTEVQWKEFLTFASTKQNSQEIASIQKNIYKQLEMSLSKSRESELEKQVTSLHLEIESLKQKLRETRFKEQQDEMNSIIPEKQLMLMEGKLEAQEKFWKSQMKIYENQLKVEREMAQKNLESLRNEITAEIEMRERKDKRRKRRIKKAKLKISKKKIEESENSEAFDIDKESDDLKHVHGDPVLITEIQNLNRESTKKSIAKLIKTDTFCDQARQEDVITNKLNQTKSKSTMEREVEIKIKTTKETPIMYNEDMDEEKGSITIHKVDNNSGSIQESEQSVEDQAAPGNKIPNRLKDSFQNEDERSDGLENITRPVPASAKKVNEKVTTMRYENKFAKARRKRIEDAANHQFTIESHGTRVSKEMNTASDLIHQTDVESLNQEKETSTDEASNPIEPDKASKPDTLQNQRPTETSTDEGSKLAESFIVPSDRLRRAQSLHSIQSEHEYANPKSILGSLENIITENPSFLNKYRSKAESDLHTELRRYGVDPEKKRLTVSQLQSAKVKVKSQRKNIPNAGELQIIRSQCREEVDRLASQSSMKKGTFRRKVTSFRKKIFQGLQNVRLRRRTNGSRRFSQRKKKAAPPLPTPADARTSEASGSVMSSGRHRISEDSGSYLSSGLQRIREDSGSVLSSGSQRISEVRGSLRYSGPQRIREDSGSNVSSYPQVPDLLQARSVSESRTANLYVNTPRDHDSASTSDDSDEDSDQANQRTTLQPQAFPRTASGQHVNHRGYENHVNPNLSFKNQVSAQTASDVRPNWKNELTINMDNIVDSTEDDDDGDNDDDEDDLSTVSQESKDEAEDISEILGPQRPVEDARGQDEIQTKRTVPLPAPRRSIIVKQANRIQDDDDDDDERSDEDEDDEEDEDISEESDEEDLDQGDDIIQREEDRKINRESDISCSDDSSDLQPVPESESFKKFEDDLKEYLENEFHVTDEETVSLQGEQVNPAKDSVSLPNQEELENRIRQEFPGESQSYPVPVPRTYRSRKPVLEVKTTSRTNSDLNTEDEQESEWESESEEDFGEETLPKATEDLENDEEDLEKIEDDVDDIEEDEDDTETLAEEEPIKLRRPDPGTKIADLTNIIEAQLKRRSLARPTGGVDPLQAAMEEEEMKAQSITDHSHTRALSTDLSTNTLGTSLWGENGVWVSRPGSAISAPNSALSFAK